MKRVITGAILDAALLGQATAVMADKKSEAEATVITVWVNGEGQDSMAKKLNAVHQEMSAQGWRFADQDLYSENGDMQGFFVTYVRDPAPVSR